MDVFAIRINTLKTTRSQVETLLAELDATFRRVGWYPDALVVSNYSMHELMEQKLYQEGLIYIQNLSSMIPVLVLHPQSGESILDVCAAPGSKTTQLAEYCGNACTVLANDSSRDRLYKLRAALKKQGCTTVTTSLFPGEALWKRYTESFDKVLIDVPCSMGQAYATKNLHRLVNRQKKLLRSGFACLKSGGRLVYATCSPRKEENEEVVAWLLKKEPSARLVPIDVFDLPDMWKTPEGMIRIPKDDFMIDFFVACIEK